MSTLGVSTLRPHASMPGARLGAEDMKMHELSGAGEGNNDSGTEEPLIEP